ncbi:MAG: FAD-dependent oxidoreductase [Oscillospiraceae bacterium]
MPSLKSLQKRLDREFDGKVFAAVERECTVLSGEVGKWDDVVRAGYMAVDKRGKRNVINDITCRGVEIPKMKLPQLSDKLQDKAEPDFLIIGAGVIGCAIARELMRYDVSVLIAEKEHDVAMQASSRNDGCVHPGIDLKKGQKKQMYNARGNAVFGKLCAELGVPFLRNGQTVCFKNKWLLPFVRLALPHWDRLGVPVEYMSGKQLHRMEPNLDEKICGGLNFPSAGMVCPYGLTIALAENAVENGARLSLDTAVLSMKVFENKIVSVETNRGTIFPKVVINAAGVFSEEVASMACDRFFSIHPRRGTNTILDKKASAKAHITVSTVDLSALKHTHTKGGGIVTTVHQNLLIGPDAVETFEKENYATSQESVVAVMGKQKNTVSLLSPSDIITYFTGVRAPTYEEDFVIECGRSTKNIVHAAGIQSPGLTAAPAIGVDVAAMAVELLRGIKPVSKNESFNPRRAPIPCLASLSADKRAEMIKMNPDYGEIVCRCEEISKGEILDALRRPVECDTVDGVKRRVRPGMGRCQGSFCGPLVLQIIAKEKHIAPENVKKSGDGSQIVFCDTKGAAKL